ncbi:MAG: beta-lactamase family protein [Bacteroidales bacterium]|nr:beta-lactamase family protein [Bacteroidales bacterium]
MKTCTPYVLMAAALLMAACGPTLEQQADEAMNKIIKELNAVGLSVAVVKNNKMVYTGAFGTKNIAEESQIDTDDLFRIASISKSFTATAIMQLYEQGKFDLDDDAGLALSLPLRHPDYPHIPITYRMLLTHTSSLNDTTGYFSYDVVDPQKTKEVWRAYNAYPPGTQYEYCNLGYNLLGGLVEVHSGARFDEYIQKHITDPLGLNAHFNVDALNRAQLVPLYHYRNGRFVESPAAYRSRAVELENYTMGRSAVIFSPTGGMKMAPKDLAKQMLVQMNQGSWGGVRILKPASVQAMQTPYGFPVGRAGDYGFAITTTPDLIEGEILRGHTGSAYGLFSAMYFEPEKKFGFVMMTNGYPPKHTNGSPLTDHPEEINNYLTIQSEVINALYSIFIKP